MNDYIRLNAVLAFCDKIIERDPSDDNPVTQAFKAFKFYAKSIPRLSIGVDLVEGGAEHD